MARFAPKPLVIGLGVFTPFVMISSRHGADLIFIFVVFRVVHVDDAHDLRYDIFDFIDVFRKVMLTWRFLVGDLVIRFPCIFPFVLSEIVMLDPKLCRSTMWPLRPVLVRVRLGGAPTVCPIRFRVVDKRFLALMA